MPKKSIAEDENVVLIQVQFTTSVKYNGELYNENQIASIPETELSQLGELVIRLNEQIIEELTPANGDNPTE